MGLSAGKDSAEGQAACCPDCAHSLIPASCGTHPS